MVNRRSKRFLTIDCETDPFDERDVPVYQKRIPQPFLWGIYDGQSEEYWEFETVYEVVKHLENMDCLVYAHNGGRFDYHYLRDFINSDDSIMVINGRMAKFRIGVCEFRDSINILPVPLAAFQKTEIDYAKLEPDVRHLHLDEIKAYLRSDCVNLWNTIDQYFTSYGRNLTQAGGAMRYWAKTFQQKPPKQSAAEFERYKPYYYGGRVQCFESGVKEVSFKVVDINSAYPLAMLHPHPFSTSAYSESKLPRDRDYHRCFFDIDAIARGCFPLRDERPGPAQGSLYFPDDNVPRRYRITGYELRTGLDLGACRIKRVHAVHRFPETIDFTGYVTHFYELKKEAEKNGLKAEREFAKLFLNSLYGKFGADPEKYQEYLIASDDSIIEWCTSRVKWDAYDQQWVCEEPGYHRAGDWGERHLLSRPLVERKHRYYNVATAASITGFVRAHLFKAMHQCQGLIYCDTDSIAARNIDALSLGPNIGEWKLELQCNQYAIAGKKLYAFRDIDPHSELIADRSGRGIKPTGKPSDFYQGPGGAWYKIAAKGADPSAADILRIAQGESLVFTPSVPTYSILQAVPTITPRTLRNTAKDIRIFPA